MKIKEVKEECLEENPLGAMSVSIFKSPGLRLWVRGVFPSITGLPSWVVCRVQDLNPLRWPGLWSVPWERLLDFFVGLDGSAT
jgi:hypothetical protein